MKIFNYEGYINERFINIFKDDIENINKYKDDIWNLLQFTYKEFGGYKTAKNIDKLLNRVYLSKLVRKNDKIVAFRLYTDKFGRKGIASGSDGTRLGKYCLFQKYKEDKTYLRSWSEISGKLEKKLLSDYGFEPIPNKYAEILLNDRKIELLDDGYHYIRIIGKNNFEQKIMVVGDVKKFIEIHNLDLEK